jgi:uncharacterized protein (TIGR04255 family)
MQQRPAGLPDYAFPPVGEVVLSVQYQPLPALQIVHLGLFWNELRNEFPRTQFHPPVEPAFENFEPQVFSPDFAIRMNMVPMPFPRVWFINEAGTELVQLQHDRLIYNWRRINKSDVYPRYEYLRSKFENVFDLYEGFIKKENISKERLTLNQIEVTYLNQIQAGPVWQNHSELDKVITLYRSVPLDDARSTVAEKALLKLSYTLYSEGQDKPNGRLHIDVGPANASPGNEPLFLVNLLVRGAPASNDKKAMLSFMNLARDRIVKTFDHITTPEMHAVWGKK